MANEMSMSLQKEGKRVKMRKRISRLVLLVVVFQLLTYAAILAFSGEFGALKEYSYNALAETAANSSTYIRSQLQEKPAVVREYAYELETMVEQLLDERGASVAELQTDRELTDSIIASSAELVAELLHRAAVNDAYFILDTGELYRDAGGDTAQAALYLRDEDPNLAGEDDGLLLVIGPDSAAQGLGLIKHSDWSEYFTPDTLDSSNFDFYYRTVQTAQENSALAQDVLGYWSRFSKVSFAVTPSMKYSLPLIAEDGTVYGILGVGLAKDTVLSGMPSNDSGLAETCYVLGYSSAGDRYDIQVSSGSAYGKLLGDASFLRVSGREGESICAFDTVTSVELVGSVQYMELYEGGSPYAQEHWALISVADRSGVLQPLLSVERLLAVAAVLSLFVAAIFAVLGSGWIVKPISDLSKLIKAKRKYNEVLRFQPSNIYEVDEITDAITQLQINVLDFSSQVSRMISVADVGVGTFMYDRTDDSVFVGQSLIKVLGLKALQSEDIVMTREEFLGSIRNPEARALIADGIAKADGRPRGDSSEEHQIDLLDGGTAWIRLGFTYSPTSAIGIVQDITDAMVEKQRIEHERDHDNLTGLLTRHAYYRSIEKLFHDKSKLGVTAFVMIDLDSLKYVNDTYGHDFGDDYIKTAASLIREFENYGGIVARISGDEFNICLPGFSSKNEIRKIVAYVRAKMQQGKCLLGDGTHIKVRASMGMSWYPDDAKSPELLMKYADFAMYSVKHSTKGGIAEFDIKSYSTDSDKLTDVEELNRIIEECRVRYAFQSIVSVKTGEVYGYEALMRVQSDIFQSPLELLTIAKTSAKLYEIERLTWTQSLANFQEQMNAGRIGKNERLFVNSIANHQLAKEVIDRLESDYPHLLGRIVMEILESESADEEIIAHKEQLMLRWGGRIALDDYGTGYNSEYALLSLHPNIIKIDRSIISGCDKDADRRMIIENLVKLTRTKGILTLAEGVETEEEMKTVISCGVDFLQGYYLARPAFEPAPLAPELTETIRRLAAQSGGQEDGERII